MRVKRVGAAVVAFLLSGVLAAGALAGVPAWTTYRHDGARSGIDPDSTSPVAPTQIWQTSALDGSIYGQPLVYQSRVYVATENDTVYALDAATGAIVWKRHLATPVAASALPCGDITPTVGITSTPVIDPTAGRIYVVADTWDGSHVSSIAHEMYALNLSDGGLAVGPVTVDPPGAPAADTPATQLQRVSLALDAGKVIIGYGGNAGDCGSYHGWLVAAPEAGGPLQAFEVDRSTSGGAIWGSGNAPAIDAGGNIWTSTGNGKGGWDYQESVIKLDPNLNVLDHWTASNWSTLDSSDADIGSSMPVLLPDGLVFQIGKAGVGYLLDASHLGGFGGEAFSQSVCGGSWGGGIYVNGAIYVTCLSGLYALSLNPAGASFSPLPGWTVNSSINGPPIFAGGLVWAVNWIGGTLYGLNPATGATVFSANLNGFAHFSTPSAAGGRLFIANHDARAPGDDVTAFLIANPSPPLPTTSVPPMPVMPPIASPTPAISRLHARAVHRKLHLSLTLSEPAKLTVVVAKLVPGRLAHHRCRAGRRRGRRCQAAIHRLTLHLSGRGGHERFAPRMRALAPGRYRITVTARDAAGRRSKPQTVIVVVRR